MRNPFREPTAPKEESEAIGSLTRMAKWTHDKLSIEWQDGVRFVDIGITDGGVRKIRCSPAEARAIASTLQQAAAEVAAHRSGEAKVKP